MASTMSRTCAICGHPAEFEHRFTGHYSSDGERISFERRLFRCTVPACGSVFYEDKVEALEGDASWDEVCQTEASEQARREAEVKAAPKPVSATARRQLAMETEQEHAQARARLRRLHWDEPAEIRAWLTDHNLPESFAIKTPGKDYGLYQPRELWRGRALQSADPRPQEPARSEFSVGDRIAHKVWGKGVVTGASTGVTTIEAEFPKIGIKRLDPNVAPITRVAGKATRARSEPTVDVGMPKPQ